MKEPRVINHNRTDESYHCRECGYHNVGIRGALGSAKAHSKRTGHTIDVYYEVWREVTYYLDGKRQYTPTPRENN